MRVKMPKWMSSIYIRILTGKFVWAPPYLGAAVGPLCGTSRGGGYSMLFPEGNNNTDREMPLQEYIDRLQNEQLD